MKRLIISMLMAIGLLVLQITPAFAINNPDDIDLGSQPQRRYKVFENVLATGDMLFSAEGYVYYASTPTDYTADEAFLFEIIDTDGITTLASRPLEAYGNRPISIYLSADQVSSLGLASGTGYIIRITGNPAVFASPTGNSVNATLLASDYIDQSTSGNTTTSNHIRNFMILVAQDMEANDSPSSSYLATVQGITYLSSAGADLFLEGVPGLNNMCPVLFLYSNEPIEGDQPASTGSYAALLTPTAQWGTSTANALTNLGLYLGINQALAGSAIAVFFGLLLTIYVYKRLQSGVATLMLIATYPFVVAWMGLMPLALAFVIMILVVILGGFYFFRQGAL